MEEADLAEIGILVGFLECTVHVDAVLLGLVAAQGDGAAALIDIHQRPEELGALQGHAVRSEATLLEVELVDVGLACLARHRIHGGLGLGGGVGQVEGVVVQHHQVHAGEAGVALRPAGGLEEVGLVVIPEDELGGLAVDVVHGGGVGVAEGRGGVAVAGAEAAVRIGSGVALGGVVVILGLGVGVLLLLRCISLALGVEDEAAVGAHGGEELVGAGGSNDFLIPERLVSPNGEGRRLDDGVLGRVGQEVLGGGVGVEVVIPSVVVSQLGVILVPIDHCGIIRSLFGGIGVLCRIKRGLCRRQAIALVRNVVADHGAGLTAGLAASRGIILSRILRLVRLEQSRIVRHRQPVVRLNRGSRGNRTVSLGRNGLKALVRVVELAHVDKGPVLRGIAGAQDGGLRDAGLDIGASASGVADPGDADGVAIHLGGEVQVAGGVGIAFRIQVHHEVGGLVVLVHRVHEANGLAGVLHLGEDQLACVDAGGRGGLPRLGVHLLTGHGVEEVVGLPHGEELVGGAGIQAGGQAEGVAGGGVAGDLELAAIQVAGIIGVGCDLVHDHPALLGPEDPLGGEIVGGDGDLHAGEVLVQGDGVRPGVVHAVALDGLAVEGVPGELPAVFMEAVTALAHLVLIVVDAELDEVHLELEEEEDHPDTEAGPEVEGIEGEGGGLLAIGGDAVVAHDPGLGALVGGELGGLALGGGGIAVIRPGGEGHGDGDAGLEVDLGLQQLHTNACADLHEGGGRQGDAGEVEVTADGADGGHPVQEGVLLQDGEAEGGRAVGVQLAASQHQHGGGAVRGDVAQALPLILLLLILHLELAAEVGVEGVGGAGEGHGGGGSVVDALFLRRLGGEAVHDVLALGAVPGDIGPAAAVRRIEGHIAGNTLSAVDVDDSAGILHDLTVADEAAAGLQVDAHHKVRVEDGADAEADLLTELEAELQEDHGAAEAVGVLHGAVLEHHGDVEAQGELHVGALHQLVVIGGLAVGVRQGVAPDVALQGPLLGALQALPGVALEGLLEVGEDALHLLGVAGVLLDGVLRGPVAPAVGGLLVGGHIAILVRGHGGLFLAGGEKGHADGEAELVPVGDEGDIVRDGEAQGRELDAHVQVELAHGVGALAGVGLLRRAAVRAAGIAEGGGVRHRADAGGVGGVHLHMVLAGLDVRVEGDGAVRGGAAAIEFMDLIGALAALGTDAEVDGVSLVEAAEIGVDVIHLLGIAAQKLAILALPCALHRQTLTEVGIRDVDLIRRLEAVEHAALVIDLPVLLLKGHIHQVPALILGFFFLRTAFLLFSDLRGVQIAFMRGKDLGRRTIRILLRHRRIILALVDVGGLPLGKVAAQGNVHGLDGTGRRAVHELIVAAVAALGLLDLGRILALADGDGEVVRILAAVHKAVALHLPAQLGERARVRDGGDEGRQDLGRIIGAGALRHGEAAGGHLVVELQELLDGLAVAAVNGG